MPPDGYKWTGIPSSEDTVKAEDLMDGIEAAESFVNHGIGRNSFKEADAVETTSDGIDLVTGLDRSQEHTHEGYIDKRHIFKPDFYGSPSPRMEAVSSQVHYRSTDDDLEKAVIFNPSTTGGSWEAIPGTVTRIKLRDSALVTFVCSFYCFEVGGISLPKSSGKEDDTFAKRGGQNRHAGYVAFTLQGKDGTVSDRFGSTVRRVYTSILKPYEALMSGTSTVGVEINRGFCLMTMQGRQQHSIMKQVSLPPGVYDLGLVFKAAEQSTTFTNARSVLKGYLTNPVTGETDGGRVRQAKHVVFRSRNMVCDVMYTERAQAEDELESWRTLNDKDPQAI